MYPAVHVKMPWFSGSVAYHDTTTDEASVPAKDSAEQLRDAALIMKSVATIRAGNDNLNLHLEPSDFLDKFVCCLK